MNPIENFRTKYPVVTSHGWVPLGESMPSILCKFQRTNRLSGQHVRSIFTKRNNLFHSRISRNASLEEYFSFESIEENIGWSSSELKTSFPSFLLRFSTNLVEKRNYNGIFCLDERIRICKECYSKGYHLLIHQCPDWRLCPVHFTRLSNNCPYCGSQLGLYRVNFDLQTSFLCTKCGKGIIGDRFVPNISLQNRIKNIQNEYSSWSDAFEKNRFNRSDLITAPSHSHHISTLVEKYGGPNWLSRSVEKPSSTQTEIQTYRLSKSLPTLKNKLNTSIKTESDTLKKTLKRKLEKCLYDVVEEIKSAFSWIDQTYSPTFTFARRVSLNYSGSRAASQVLVTLKTEVEEYITDIDLEFENSGFWRGWQNGPGSLQPGRGTPINISHQDLLRFSEIWFNSTLKAMFKYMLLSSYYTGRGNACEFMMSEIYCSMEREFGQPIIYRKENTFTVVSMFAELREFAKVINMSADNASSKLLNYGFEKKLATLVVCSPYKRNELLRIYEESCDIP